MALVGERAEVEEEDEAGVAEVTPTTTSHRAADRRHNKTRLQRHHRMKHRHKG